MYFEEYPWFNENLVYKNQRLLEFCREQTSYIRLDLEKLFAYPFVAMQCTLVAAFNISDTFTICFYVWYDGTLST